MATLKLKEKPAASEPLPKTARVATPSTSRLPPWTQGAETLKRREQMRDKARRAAQAAEVDSHPALQIYKEPIAFRTTITPAVAYVFLEKREGKNRPLRPSLVVDYSMAMNEGKWALNGETIKVDYNGLLIDGQHRLSMVIETGKNLDTFMIAGLSPDAFDTVDLGAKRTLAQALAIRGYSYTTNLAAAARILWRYEHDTLPWSGIKPDASSIYQIVKENPALVDAVRRAWPAHQTIRVNVHAAFYYIFSRIDRQVADEFSTRIRWGVFGQEDLGHPWYRLREKLAKEGKRGNGVDQIDNLISDVMNAWNMVRRGERCLNGKLRYTERFPKLL